MSGAVADEAALIKNKRIQLACLKAYGELTNRKMGSQILGSFCMVGVNVAAQILTHFDEPFSIVTGYFHMEDPVTKRPLHPYSFAHAWLQSGIKGSVTDICFSDPRRQILVMGTAMAFVNDAIRPTYTISPKYAVYTGELGRPSLPLETIDAEVLRITANLPKPTVPKFLEAELAEILKVAFDPSPSMKLHVSEQMLAAAAGAEAAAETLQQDDPAPASDRVFSGLE